MTTKLRYKPGETQGSWVGRLADAAGPSLNQVADRAKVPRETLSRIVNDKKNLTKAMATRLAPTLDISVERLLLPPEVEVESRRGLDLRLQSVEARAEKAEQLLDSLVARLALAGIELPESQDSARSAPSARRRGAAKTGTG